MTMRWLLLIVTILVLIVWLTTPESGSVGYNCSGGQTTRYGDDLEMCRDVVAL